MSDLGSEMEEDEIVDLHPARDNSADDGWGIDEAVDPAGTSPPGAHEPGGEASVASGATAYDELRTAAEIPGASASVTCDAGGDGWGDALPDISIHDLGADVSPLPDGVRAPEGGDVGEGRVEDAGESLVGDLPDGDRWEDDEDQTPAVVEFESGQRIVEKGAATPSADLAGDRALDATAQAIAEDSARRQVEQAIQERGDTPPIDRLLREIDDHTVPIEWQDIDMRSDSDTIRLADDVENVARIPSDPECFQLVTHGSVDGLQANIDGIPVDLNVEQTAAIIEANADWSQRPVRIFGCSSGAGEFAQRLADRLRVDVIAPTDIVHVNDDGTTVIFGDDGSPGYWNLFRSMR